MTVVVERPDAEAQLAGLAFAMLLLDETGRIAEANHAAEDLIGRSATRMVSVAVTEVIEFADTRIIDRLADEEARLVARGVAARIAEQSHRVNVTVSPLATHPGWRVLTISDARQDDMAHEGERDGPLRAPAVLAHEIKNPLTAIRGATQLIGRKLEEKDRPLAQMIADEVDRIARLIDRMQKLGSSTSEPVSPINLHETIRNAIGTVRAGKGAKIELVEEFDPSLPPVLGHADALEQVMINLLSNGCDACADQPEPRIIVRTRFSGGLALTRIRLGRSVRLPIEVSVTDNGPGLDPALGEHLFEPFVTSKKGGQGLGLALCKKLVSDMHGRISHERDDRAGLTHFRIHLPVAEKG